MEVFLLFLVNMNFIFYYYMRFLLKDNINYILKFHLTTISIFVIKIKHKIV